MDLEVTDSYSALSFRAADLVCATVEDEPHAALLLAMGDTPAGLYEELVRRRRAGAFDPAQMRVIQLDEYVGVDDRDPRSLYGWLRRAVLQPLAIDDGRVIRLRGNVSDLRLECAAYEEAIRSIGGITLSVLGLGPNGHLGFNEPPVSADAPTREIRLAEASLRSNARYWGEGAAVPSRALTAGMNVLLAARKSILLVSGDRKRDILARTLATADDPDIPASFLQGAADVTVIADRAAYPG